MFSAKGNMGFCEQRWSYVTASTQPSLARIPHKDLA